MADPTGPIEPDQTRPAPEPEPRPDPAEELERLRELLLGKETRDLGELRQRFDDWELTPEEVAEQLPEAIGLRTSQDESLGRALAPTLEAGISESVQRGLRSRAFDRGRDSAKREAAALRFHRQLARDLQGGVEESA